MKSYAPRKHDKSKRHSRKDWPAAIIHGYGPITSNPPVAHALRRSKDQKRKVRLALAKK